VSGPRLRAFEFTVNVMEFADVVTVPDAGEAVVTEYFTLPRDRDSQPNGLFCR
jgi:hypothetical protein